MRTRVDSRERVARATTEELFGREQRSAMRLLTVCLLAFGCVPEPVDSARSHDAAPAGAGGSSDAAGAGGGAGNDGAGASDGAVVPREWARAYGGAARIRANAIAIGATGTTYVAGSFLGSVDFGGGPRTAASAEWVDLFLMGLTPGGEHSWSLTFGDVYGDEAFDVLVNSANDIVVVGAFSGTVNFGAGPLKSVGSADGFAAAFSPLGAFRWARSFGSTAYDQALGLANDGSNDVRIAGSYLAPMQLGPSALPARGSDDGFLATISGTGDLLPSLSFGGAGSEVPRGIAVDPVGNVILVGNFNGSPPDFGTGPLPYGGGNDFFVVSYAPTGAVLWAKTFGGGAGEEPRDVVADAAGNVYVTGIFQGAFDLGGPALSSAGQTEIVVASFTSSGAHRWSKRFGGPGFDHGQALALDTAGHVVLAGRCDGGVEFGGSVYGAPGEYGFCVAGLLPADGMVDWVRRFPSTGVAEAYDVAVAPDAVAVCGEFNGKLDVGTSGTMLTATGSEGNAFVIRFDPDSI